MKVQKNKFKTLLKQEKKEDLDDWKEDLDIAIEEKKTGVKIERKPKKGQPAKIEEIKKEDE